MAGKVGAASGVLRRPRASVGALGLVLQGLAAFAFVLAVLCSGARAHHVLGRPAYSLNEDSNTPPAIQVETQVGDYAINYMIFPAFPRPGVPGRINFYARKIDGSGPFKGKVTFQVKDNSWAAWFGFGGEPETLGVQVIDDNVYRQGFLFQKPGDYIITAAFKDGDMPYVIDFPLRIGPPSRVGPVAIAAGLILALLIGVSVVQRRRAMTGKLRAAHAGGGSGAKHTGGADGAEGEAP